MPAWPTMRSKSTGLRLSLGHSNIEASGSLNQGLKFQSRLALGELGRLVNETSFPNDMASVNGTATLDSQNNLTLTGVRASALGGEFAGDASLKDFTTYQVRGDLRHLDLANAIRVAGQTTSALRWCALRACQRRWKLPHRSPRFDGTSEAFRFFRDRTESRYRAISTADLLGRQGRCLDSKVASHPAAFPAQRGWFGGQAVECRADYHQSG